MTEIMPKVCKNPFSTLLAHSTVVTTPSVDIPSTWGRPAPVIGICAFACKYF